ncbi:MAG TPA: carbohydrate-binding family 9-like protein [Cyclobacteriaceae bacterium]|nr:carbohydrate-binding family 9-like protein [Cyclobacteriaceae bacterium]
MKMISVPFIGRDIPSDGLSAFIRNFEKHPVNILNWLNYPYQPVVEFTMAWSESRLFLYYHVTEDSVMARTGEDNGPVWKDSCVEFFVSPGGNGHYYNFEFNCIGACLLAYGDSRKDREFAGPEILSRIKRVSSLGNKTFEEINGSHEWDLYIEIPADAFFKHPDFKFRKSLMKGNFYKCGDDLSKPHYLTWSPINTDKPDYHRPEFFGNIILNS